MNFYKRASERYWFVLSTIFGLSTLAILLKMVFGTSVVETAFGERWVSTEVVLFHIPVWLIPGVSVDSAIQFKPITLFMAFSFLWFATGFQSLKPSLNSMINRFPMIRGVIIVMAFTICLVAGYETIWNFIALGAVLSSLPNTVAFNKVVDSVVFQYTWYPVNAVFATKMFSIALFIGIYTLYAIREMN